MDYLLLGGAHFVAEGGKYLVVMQKQGYKLHKGCFYSAIYTDIALADAAYFDVLIETTTKKFHMAGSVAIGGDANMNLFEAPTDVSGGTPMDVYNMSRIFGNGEVTSFKHSPTVTDPGSVDLLGNYFIPGGGHLLTRVGGHARQGSEWVLAKNTK